MLIDHNEVTLIPCSLQMTASTADQFLLPASDRTLFVYAAYFTPSTTGTGTIDLKKCAAGVAPASGVSVLTAAFDIATASQHTPKALSIAGTGALATIPQGYTLALDVSSLSTLVGNLTIWFGPG